MRERVRLFRLARNLTHPSQSPVEILRASGDSIVPYLVEAIATDSSDYARLDLVTGLEEMVDLDSVSVDSSQLLVLDEAIGRMQQARQPAEGSIRRIRWTLQERLVRRR